MAVRRRPWLSVQPTIAEVLRDVQANRVDTEEVWVSACDAEHSMHGTLSCKRLSDGVDLVATAPWHAERTANADVWDVSTKGDVCVHAQVHVPRVQHAWKGTYAPIVLDLGVSAAGLERWAIGGAEGQLYAGEWHGGASAQAVPSIVCAGHVSDVTSVRFFPSGEVLLSTSLDMHARIFSALDGTCPRTLQGHTRAVVGSAILGRGRQVATGSADHTVRVWDVGRGTTVQVWTRDEPVAALGVYGAADATPEVPTGALLAGGASGVAAWDLREAPGAAWTLALPSAAHNVSALCAYDASVWVGTHDGAVAVYDVRAPAMPVDAWRRSSARITDVWSDAHGALIATSDGQPYTVDGGSEAVRELAGWDATTTSAVRRDAQGHAIVGGPEGWAWYA